MPLGVMMREMGGVERLWMYCSSRMNGRCAVVPFRLPHADGTRGEARRGEHRKCRTCETQSHSPDSCHSDDLAFLSVLQLRSLSPSISRAVLLHTFEKDGYHRLLYIRCMRCFQALLLPARWNHGGFRRRAVGVGVGRPVHRG